MKVDRYNGKLIDKIKKKKLNDEHLLAMQNIARENLNINTQTKVQSDEMKMKNKQQIKTKLNRFVGDFKNLKFDDEE